MTDTESSHLGVARLIARQSFLTDMATSPVKDGIYLNREGGTGELRGSKFFPVDDLFPDSMKVV